GDIHAQQASKVHASLVDQDAIRDEAKRPEEQKPRARLQAAPDHRVATDLQQRGANEHDNRPDDIHLWSSALGGEAGFRNTIMCWRGNPGIRRSNMNPSASTSVRASATLMRCVSAMGMLGSSLRYSTRTNSAPGFNDRRMLRSISCG